MPKKRKKWIDIHPDLAKKEFWKNKTYRRLWQVKKNWLVIY